MLHSSRSIFVFFAWRKPKQRRQPKPKRRLVHVPYTCWGAPAAGPPSFHPWPAHPPIVSTWTHPGRPSPDRTSTSTSTTHGVVAGREQQQNSASFFPCVRGAVGWTPPGSSLVPSPSPLPREPTTSSPSTRLPSPVPLPSLSVHIPRPAAAASCSAVVPFPGLQLYLPAAAQLLCWPIGAGLGPGPGSIRGTTTPAPSPSFSSAAAPPPPEGFHLVLTYGARRLQQYA